MRKQFILLPTLILLFLSSCVYEHFYKPQKTAIAYSIYQTAVKSNLDLYLGTFNLLLKVDLWLKAPDDDSRYEIEDTWLSNYKLRTKGDTLFVISPFNIKAITILTRKSSILTPDAEWQVRVGWQTLRFRCTSDNNWELFHTDSLVELSPETHLSLQLQSADASTLALSMTGKGYGFAPPLLREYEIKQRLNIDYSDSTIFPNPIFKITTGELCVIAADQPTPDLEQITVRFNRGGTYTLTFMGITEEWWY